MPRQPSRAKKISKAREAKLHHDRLTKRANKATAGQILSMVPGVFDFKEVSYSTQVFMSSELAEVDQVSIWEMLKNSMQQMYANSSLGWDPPSKKEELFHHDSRFILLRPSQAQDEDLPIAAYAMFRFEVENEECVLYCYELQVSPSVQRGGIGKTLIGCLCDIACKWNMQKIVLTVLKENKGAFSLYKTMGFDVEEEGVDYSIMSKLVES